MALIAPVLIVIIFGIINFGILFAQKLALNNAVREGARYAVAAGPKTETAEQKVRKALWGVIYFNPNAVEFEDTVLTYTDGSTKKLPRDCSAAGSGDDMGITAKYQTDLLVQILPLGPFTLSGTAVYRCEW